MRGALLTADFLVSGITQSVAWQTLDPDAYASFRRVLVDVYGRVEGDTRLNEAQTESTLINPTLYALGWEPLPQEQANTRGRAEVPDGLLFATA